MIVVGYGQSGQDYDFFLYDAEGRVWNGTTYVTWDAAEYQDYRVAAGESGGPGRYVATVPTGAEALVATVEIRYRAGTLDGSYVVWTGEVAGTATDTAADYTGSLTSEITATAQGPASFQTDGQQAVAQPIPHLIQADQYLTRKRVARRRGFWGQVSIARTIPPGAVEETC